MYDWRKDVWFFDTEVLPHDWLFCATDGENRVSIRNDKARLEDFITSYNPLLCGYNSKHYDNYIIKAILAGFTPEQVKEVNDLIIVEGVNGWEIEMGWISIPDSIDLMLDLPTRPSLKAIEGNLKMNIEESAVGFDTESPTTEQWNELEDYCWHDVEALRPLYEARSSYLEGKETLADMAGLDVRKALNMTNAKLTAKFLGARLVERDDERNYVYPNNIRSELIPKSVFEFFNRLPEGKLSLDVLFGKEGVPDENGKVVKSRNPYKNLAIDLAGCPTVYGWGGVHGALPFYKGKSDDEGVILNLDVASYYPNLMVVNNYISRNIQDKDIFKTVLEQRLEAKKAGDKKTADALKLVVNTTYGASNNKYNDLYDPLMAHSVCISGQLYLTQLVNMLNKIDTVQIININTDGVMFYIKRSYRDEVTKVIKEWESDTGFVLEETVVDTMIQRDVNNYIMREENGDIKVKGGVVSDYKGGDFKHNSMPVVARAIVNYLLDDISIEYTINSSKDIFDFQMITKAGGSYERVVHETDIGDIEVNRTNRIFASKDERVGAVYKIKENGRRDKIANCPDHAIVNNNGDLPIDTINKQWYIDLAIKRANEFRGIKPQRRKKKMKKEEELEVVIEDDDTPTTKTIKKEKKIVTKTKEEKVEVPNFNEKLFNLANDVAEMASSFIKDGYNDHQSYEYVKAQQYKAILRKSLAKNRLRYKLDDAVCQMNETLKSDKMVLTLYHGMLTIIDLDSDGRETYMVWSQGADNLDKGLSKAKTLAIKDFIKANYLISDAEDDPEASDNKATKKAPSKFTPPSELKEKAKEVVKEKNMATTEVVERLKANIDAIRNASGDTTYGEKTLKELDKPITSSRAVVLATKLEMKAGEYGLEV